MGFFRDISGSCRASLGRLALTTGAFGALVFSPTAASADVTHVVAKGHTIATVAARYHVSVRAITDANPKVNPKRLQIGDTLTIPGVAPKAGDKAAPAKSEGQAKAAPTGKAAPPAATAAHATGAPSVPALPAHGSPVPAPAQHGGARGATASANLASAPSGKHGKDSYTGKPKQPNVVHLVRFGTAEEAAVKVSTRGKVPGPALEQFKKLMHSSSGQTHTPDARLVALLGIVSNHFGGKKIEIISGFRPFSPKQYTPHSNHNHGRAMDFRVQGVPNTVLRDYCRTLHDVGVGYYPNSVFVHLDVRSAPAFWIDYSKPGEAPRYQAPNVDADEGASDVHAEHPGLNGPQPSAPAEAPAAPGAAVEKPAEKPAEAAAPKVEIPKPSAGAPSTAPSP
jgi:uncharacterized protein YcbK (DUF882 family)